LVGKDMHLTRKPPQKHLPSHNDDDDKKRTMIAFPRDSFYARRISNISRGMVVSTLGGCVECLSLTLELSLTPFQSSFFVFVFLSLLVGNKKSWTCLDLHVPHCDMNVSGYHIPY
jgi:hypothetical protein